MYNIAIRGNNMRKIIIISLIVYFLLCNTAVSVDQEKQIINNGANEKIGTDDWFYYPSFDNYAPSGMPDFDQKQDNWKDPWYQGYSFCGPTALSNILWYFDSMYSDPLGTIGDGADFFSLVQDYHAPGISVPGPYSDDHNYNNINDLETPWNPDQSLFGNEFIERLAWYCDTNGCQSGSEELGTTVININNGFTSWTRDKGLRQHFRSEIFTMLSGTQDIKKLPEYLKYFTEPIPMQDEITFEEFASRIETGECAAILIYIYDYSGNYIYGHWVTVAGVNSALQQIAISDPYIDITNPTNDYTLHNDAAIVSHDIYEINTTIPSPHNGLWCFEEYESNRHTITAAVVFYTQTNDIVITGPDIGYDDIENVEFYIDGDLKTTCTEIPYEYEWNTRSFGRHLIEIIAYDTIENQIKGDYYIWKFL
jgi:hypothetical protein